MESQQFSAPSTWLIVHVKHHGSQQRNNASTTQTFSPHLNLFFLFSFLHITSCCHFEKPEALSKPDKASFCLDIRHQDNTT